MNKEDRKIIAELRKKYNIDERLLQSEKEDTEELQKEYDHHKTDIEKEEGWYKKFHTIPDVEGTRHLDIGWAEAELPIIGATLGVDPASDIVYPEYVKERPDDLWLYPRSNPFFKRIDFEEIAAEGENLPFRDGTIDSVSSQNSMGEYFDLQKGLAEGIRVLRSGGKLQVVVWYPPKYIKVIKDWLRKQPVKNIKITQIEDDYDSYCTMTFESIEYACAFYGIEFTKV